MTFQRRILHHGPNPLGTPVVLSLEAVRNCWFELHRQGGCGSGELRLSTSFVHRDQIELGDWISFEVAPGVRWYLGRIEERTSSSPAEIRFRLEGMAIELNEVFPGGFGLQADGRRPHRYAATDLFTHDPDRSIETFNSAQSVTDAVTLLLTQYVTPATHIRHEPFRVEAPVQTAEVTSLKFRGEESVRSILKELATRAQSASWGVDETGTFFFLQPRFPSLKSFQEGVDLTKLRESRDREYLFNRLLLTGDYIYDRRDQSGDIARRSYRWRGNYMEPISQSQHGDRRIRIWVPWVRTQRDSVAFAREFLRSYSQPVSRFLIDTTAQVSLLKPWEGRISLLDQSGNHLTTAFAETIRVQFDHAPTFRMELGPLDPRTLWPEPPQDERWELPEQAGSAGGPVSLPPPLPDNGDGGGGGGDGSGGGGDGSPSSGTQSFSESSGISSGPGSSLFSSGVSSSANQSFPSSEIDSSSFGVSSGVRSSNDFSSGNLSSMNSQSMGDSTTDSNTSGRASSGGMSSSGAASNYSSFPSSSGWQSPAQMSSSEPPSSVIFAPSSQMVSSVSQNSESSSPASSVPDNNSTGGAFSHQSSVP